MKKTHHPFEGLVWLALGVALVFAVACEDEAASTQAEEPAPQAVAEKPEKPAPEQPAGEPVNTPEEIVKEPHFELRLVEAGPYKAGELGRFMVSVTPRGEYHINEEFPYSVHVQPPEGVEVPKPALETEDAETFNEKLAEFAVPFTAKQAGTHRIEATIDFAVCTDENCIPEQRELALNISVD